MTCDAPSIDIGAGRRQTGSSCRDVAQASKAEERPPQTSGYNARSLNNKIDEQQPAMDVNYYIHDCCVLVISESG